MSDIRLGINGQQIVVYFGDNPTPVLAGDWQPMDADRRTVYAKLYDRTHAMSVSQSATSAVSVTTYYAVQGADVVQTIVVANEGHSAVTGTLEGPFVALTGTPDGNQSLDWTNGFGLAAESNYIWPSNRNPIEAVEIGSGSVRMVTWSDVTTPHLLRPDVIDDNGPRANFRWQLYNPTQVINPHDSIAYTVTTRLTSSTVIDDLYSGVKASLSELPSTASWIKPVIQTCSADPTWVRPDNPYGFNDAGDDNNWRRLDTDGGSDAMIAYYGQNFAGKAGALCWWDPGGVEWNADHTAAVVWTVDTVSSINRLKDKFVKVLAGNKKNGIDTWVIYRADVTRSLVDMYAQLDTFVELGITGIYVDSGGFDPGTNDKLRLMALHAPQLVFMPEGSNTGTIGTVYYDQLNDLQGNCLNHGAYQIQLLYYLQGKRCLFRNYTNQTLTAADYQRLGSAYIPLVFDSDINQLTTYPGLSS